MWFWFLWILYAFYREASVIAWYWHDPDTANVAALVTYYLIGLLGAVVLFLHFLAVRLAWAALAAIRFALLLVVFFAGPLVGSGSHDGMIPYANVAFVSALVFTIAALVSGASQAQWTSRLEAFFARVFLLFGWAIWTRAQWVELERSVPNWSVDGTSGTYKASAFMIVVALSALLFALLARLSRRPALADYRYALTALSAVWLAVRIADGTGPLAYGGAVAWPLLLGTHYLLLWTREQPGAPFERWLHFSGFWLLTALVGWFGYQFTETHVNATSAWKETFLLTLPILTVVLVLQWPEGRFPFGRDRRAYLTWGLAPHLVGLTLLSQYWNLSSSGDPSPLPYVPGANPLGLAIGACLLTLVYWHRAMRASSWALSPRRFAGLVGGLSFLWLTMGLVRAVHHFAGVPWDFDALASSTQLHTSLSIFWSSVGFLTMIVGHRRGYRALWIFGCCLLVLVVFKLFAIDLKGRGTLERIISFIGTGVVLLLTGYFAPIPPSTKQVPDETNGTERTTSP